MAERHPTPLQEMVLTGDQAAEEVVLVVRLEVAAPLLPVKATMAAKAIKLASLVVAVALPRQVTQTPMTVETVQPHLSQAHLSHTLVGVAVADIPDFQQAQVDQAVVALEQRAVEETPPTAAPL